MKDGTHLTYHKTKNESMIFRVKCYKNILSYCYNNNVSSCYINLQEVMIVVKTPTTVTLCNLLGRQADLIGEFRIRAIPEKKYLGGEDGRRYIFLWVVGAHIFQIIWVLGV